MPDKGAEEPGSGGVTPGGSTPKHGLQKPDSPARVFSGLQTAFILILVMLGYGAIWWVHIPWPWHRFEWFGTALVIIYFQAAVTMLGVNEFVKELARFQGPP